MHRMPPRVDPSGGKTPLGKRPSIDLPALVAGTLIATALSANLSFEAKRASQEDLRLRPSAVLALGAGEGAQAEAPAHGAGGLACALSPSKNSARRSLFSDPSPKQKGAAEATKRILAESAVGADLPAAAEAGGIRIAAVPGLVFGQGLEAFSEAQADVDPPKSA